MAITYGDEKSASYIYRFHIEDNSTQLNGDITYSVTTITVDDTTSFTSSGYIVIEDEIIKYTGKTSTTFTGCTRGAGGTKKEAHTDGTNVYQGTFSDNLAGTSSFDYFQDDAKVGDCFYFAGDVGTSNVDYVDLREWKFYVGTPLVADNITIEWQIVKSAYLNGGYFFETVPTTDKTNAFQNAGENYVSMDLSNVSRWMYSFYGPVNSRYFIRAKITALTNLTEGGAQSTQELQGKRHFIKITDYTEGSPANFDDIYNADKAGSVTLLWPENCTTNHTLTHQIRPTDKLALKIDFILSGTSAGAGDTIDITGTDAFGNTLNESIDVSAGDGTYTTSNYFKTITSFDCNGWTDGKIEVKQNQWGFVWKNNNQYTFDIRFDVHTYFTDTNKQIQFNDDIIFTSYTGMINLMSGSHFTLGTLVNIDDKSSKDGCAIIARQTHMCHWQKLINHYTNSESNIYSSYFSSEDSTFYFENIGNAFSCIFENIIVNTGDWNAYDLTLVGGARGHYPVGDFDNIRVIDSIYGFTLGWSYDQTIKNLVLLGTTSYDIYAYYISVPKYLINLVPKNDPIKAYYYARPGYEDTPVWQQYEIDLKVIDKNNEPISGATVTLWDVDETQVFNETTSANGTISTQIVNYKKYTKGASSSNPTITTYSPHTIQISKAGYQTYKKKFTLDKKIDWIIGLKRISINIDNEVVT